MRRLLRKFLGWVLGPPIPLLGLAELEDAHVHERDRLRQEVATSLQLVVAMALREGDDVHISPDFFDMAADPSLVLDLTRDDDGIHVRLRVESNEQ